MYHNLFFLTKLLILGILFSTAVNAEIVAKPLILGTLFSAAVNEEDVAQPAILGISFLTSFIFVLRLLLGAKLLIFSILSSISFILASYSVFLTTSLLSTLLNLIKSAGTGANLSIYNLSTSVFKLATFAFNANLKYLHE